MEHYNLHVRICVYCLVFLFNPPLPLSSAPSTFPPLPYPLYLNPSWVPTPGTSFLNTWPSELLLPTARACLSQLVYEVQPYAPPSAGFQTATANPSSLLTRAKHCDRKSFGVKLVSNYYRWGENLDWLSHTCLVYTPSPGPSSTDRCQRWDVGVPGQWV